MIRKLVLSSAITFLAPGSDTQILLSILLHLTAHFAHAIVLPFRERRDNILQHFALCIPWVTLWIGLAIKLEAFDDLGIKIISSFALSLNFAVLLLSVLSAYFKVTDHKRPKTANFRGTLDAEGGVMPDPGKMFRRASLPKDAIEDGIRGGGAAAAAAAGSDTLGGGNGESVPGGGGPRADRRNSMSLKEQQAQLDFQRRAALIEAGATEAELAAFDAQVNLQGGHVDFEDRDDHGLDDEDGQGEEEDYDGEEDVMYRGGGAAGVSSGLSTSSAGAAAAGRYHKSHASEIGVSDKDERDSNEDPTIPNNTNNKNLEARALVKRGDHTLSSFDNTGVAGASSSSVGGGVRATGDSVGDSASAAEVVAVAALRKTFNTTDGGDNFLPLPAGGAAGSTSGAAATAAAAAAAAAPALVRPQSAHLFAQLAPLSIPSATLVPFAVQPSEARVPSAASSPKAAAAAGTASTTPTGSGGQRRPIPTAFGPGVGPSSLPSPNNAAATFHLDVDVSDDDERRAGAGTSAGAGPPRTELEMQTRNPSRH